MKKLIAIMLIITLLVVGCGTTKTVQPTKTTTEPTTESTTESTTEGEVTGEIEDIEDLETELDLSELDNLDKELGEINW